ncbi:MAG TPA: serine/threonine-protein kinase [Polyangiaceae bacterium]|nr:serine/threonine-protein kinase [Polyangiaceae bacterium]
MDEWFVCVPGGDPVGPVSTALLILGIRSGKVPDDALVCRVGEKTWTGVMEESALAAAMPGPEAFRGAEADSRYKPKSVLGVGGMGEVHLCADEWIGRDVAMKIALGGKDVEPHLRARFIREALVQGQLEHPSVVPVYDLGTRPDGATFFTMKRVHGLTLAQIVEGHRKNDAKIVKTYSRRRLLTAMSNVCLAVSFAHSRGIVHRDLKPENVMFGDFGEVYVLDWGVAKVLEDSWAVKASATAGAPVGRTQAGSIIGTPGYVSPEQVQGEVAIGPPSDVYALGAILFELLALEPLHRGNTTAALSASTLALDGEKPSSRAESRNISPELDAICAKATARDPKKRYATGREMQEAIERYLDGERDREQRKEIAKRHADAAERAFEAAAKAGPAGEPDRARGLRELGAALALEPSNEDAMRTLMRVLLDTPSELPPEAEAELQALEKKDRVRGAKDGALVYTLFSVPAILLFTMHVKQPLLFLLVALVTLGTQGYFFWMWKTGNAERKYMRIAVPLSFLLVALQSTVFGPFVIAPGAAAVTIAAFLVSLRAGKEVRRLVLLAGVASVAIPALLQFVGLTPRSYGVVAGNIVLRSDLVEFETVPAMLLLAFGSISTMFATLMTVGQSVDALVASERRNFAQAFRLRQLLPSGGRMQSNPPGV